MPRNQLNNLVGRLGSHRRRSEVLQVLSFPGLSVDNAPSVPGVSGTGTGSSGSGSASGVNQQVSDLSTQLNNLKTVQQTQLDKLNENTQALLSNTSSRGLTGSGGTSGTGIASSLLAATGISPIISGLLSLFGGSSTQTVQRLTPFSLPPSIQYAGAVQGNGSVTPVDYGQNGMPRPLNSGAASQQMVQIQVNALDSQSFMDHSEDIAQAVRQAILNSSTLNDVIADI